MADKCDLGRPNPGPHNMDQQCRHHNRIQDFEGKLDHVDNTFGSKRPTKWGHEWRINHCYKLTESSWHKSHITAITSVEELTILGLEVLFRTWWISINKKNIYKHICITISHVKLNTYRSIQNSPRENPNSYLLTRRFPSRVTMLGTPSVSPAMGD